MPPEQMYELMKQMKFCIQNNPSEARQMLLLNPQLAYALLQSMVVMRIVDPQTAVVRFYSLENYLNFPKQEFNKKKFIIFLNFVFKDNAVSCQSNATSAYCK